VRGFATAGWRRGAPGMGLAVVALALFVDMLLYGLIVPLLPAYARDLDLSEGQVGALVGIYALAVLLATPLCGALADRVGRRTPMVAGLLGLMAATLLFAFAGSYGELLVARALQGLAAAATWTAGLALVADLYPATGRGRAMGLALLGVTAGTLLGPPLGGLLYEWGGARLPFLAAALLAGLDGLARVLFLAEPPPARSVGPSWRALLGDPAVRGAAGAVAIGAGAWALLEPTLPLHLERRHGLSPAAIGFVFGAATLVYGLASPVVGALSDRRGRRPAMAGGLAALAVTLPLVGLPGPAVVPVAAALLVSVAYGFAVTPALPELGDAVDRLGGGAYGAAYAVFNVAYALGMMAGPVVGGLLSEALGFLPALLVAGLVVLAGLPPLVSTRPGLWSRR
jgi:DHA1 family solute carrier family 18 vesicular amine transporter 1/2